MTGLGLGSLAGGHLADRLSVRGRFLAFAASELAIAAFGFASVWLYYDVLCVRLGPLGLSPTAHCRFSVPDPALAHFLHGDVASSPGPCPHGQRLEGRRKGRGPVRVEHLRRRGGLAGDGLVAGADRRLPRHRRLGRLAEPCLRGRGAADWATVLADSGGASSITARRTGAGNGGGAYRPLAHRAEGLARDLRALRLHRAVAGDPLVPPARRPAAFQLVHVCHVACPLPLGRRAGRPRRRTPGAAAAAARPDLPGAAVGSDALRGALVGGPHLRTRPLRFPGAAVGPPPAGRSRSRSTWRSAPRSG